MAKSVDKTLDLELHSEALRAHFLRPKENADAPPVVEVPPSERSEARADARLDLPVAGEITLRFYDSGAGQLVPQVSFGPLGRINPNTIEKHLPFIYREIQRQQVIERKR
jgi:hypothetical protein